MKTFFFAACFFESGLEYDADARYDRDVGLESSGVAVAKAVTISSLFVTAMFGQEGVQIDPCEVGLRDEVVQARVILCKYSWRDDSMTFLTLCEE